MQKQTKTAFRLAVIFTGIGFVAELLAIFLGVEGLQVVYNPTENGEALALIVLLPLFLIVAAAVLVFSVLAISPSIAGIRKQVRRKESIVLLSINIAWNVLNIVLLLCMILH